MFSGSVPGCSVLLTVVRLRMINIQTTVFTRLHNYLAKEIKVKNVTRRFDVSNISYQE